VPVTIRKQKAPVCLSGAFLLVILAYFDLKR